MHKVEKNMEWLSKKVAAIIDEQTNKGKGTKVRDIYQRVPSNLRILALGILEGWVIEGKVILSGTGKPGSPVIVSRP